MKKILFNILLSLCLVLSVFSLSVLADDEISVEIKTGLTVTLRDTDGDSYYEIGTADELFAFAAIVNNGQSSINARLTADIDVSGRRWTPIGYDTNTYSGTFDGAYHTVTGLTYSGWPYTALNKYVVGFFCAIDNDGCVKNLGLLNIDLSTSTDENVCLAGVAVYNNGTITNCYTTGQITSPDEGYHNSMINKGGGIAYQNKGTVSNCYSTVKFSGGELNLSYVGGIVGYNYENAYVTNCYSTRTPITPQGNRGDSVNNAQKSAEQFASGEVAYLLGDAFGQNLGVDSYPAFYAPKVNYGYINCADDAQAIYTNTDTFDKKPEHKPIADDKDCTTEAICTVCGDVTTAAYKSHNFEGGECSNPGCEFWATYHMTYYVDGKITFSESYTCGKAYYPWTPPEKEGLTFQGWATEEGGEVVYRDSDYCWPYSDIDFYAVYGTVYTVRYNEYDGEQDCYYDVGYDTVDAGQTLRLYSQYSYWYKCIGWATEPYGEMVYGVNEEITPTEDLNLYAVVVPFTATIDLGAADAFYKDEDGNTITQLQGTMPYSHLIITVFPIRPGYVFTGFMDQYRYVHEIMVDEETSISYIDVGMSEDSTLTALWKECEEHRFENGKCQLCAYELSPCTVWNVTLKDNIAVNFHLKISGEKIAAASVTVNGEVVDITDLPLDEDGNPVLTVELAAARMTEKLTLALTLDGTTITKDYSVRMYADVVLAGDYDEPIKEMVKYMLSYGGAAQAYFEHNTDHPADQGITGLTPVDIPETVEDMATSGAIENLSYYGTSLVYQNCIAVRYYFTGDVTGLTFTANGNTYTPVAKDGMHYIEIADILPQNLDQQITLTVTDANGKTLAVTYGPMNYIVRMNQKDNQDLKNLLKALYNYHLAAKAL